MSAIFSWLTENWESVVAILAAAHGLAVVIVNLTPTPKDDEWVAKIYSVVEMVAGLFTSKAKETGATETTTDQVAE